MTKRSQSEISQSDIFYCPHAPKCCFNTTNEQDFLFHLADSHGKVEDSGTDDDDDGDGDYGSYKKSISIYTRERKRQKIRRMRIPQMIKEDMFPKLVCA